MSEMKKFILVPPDAFVKLNSAVDPSSALDKELYAILADKKMPDYEKVIKYQQTLQRFLFHQKEKRTPIRMDIDEESVESEDQPPPPTPSVNHNESILNEIQQSVPKAFKAKATSLFKKLESLPGISWSPQGEVSINEEKISYSNILDLISDAMRSRKDFLATGRDEFAEFIKEQRVPTDWIGNPYYKGVNTPAKQSTPAKVNQPSKPKVSPVTFNWNRY